MQSLNPAILIGLGAFFAMALGVFLWLRLRRIAPEERERRRRLEVNRHARTFEAFITEASEDVIHYQYEFRGVEYFASQDVTGLRAQLPDDPKRLIGPACVKIVPRNPANSILLCEEWSGLRPLISQGEAQLKS